MNVGSVWYVHACNNCVAATCTQTEMLVDVSHPTWHTDSDSWVTDSLEIADGVVVARTLFGAEDLCMVVRVLNLTDRPYKLRQDQLLGTALQVEVYDPVHVFWGWEWF